MSNEDFEELGPFIIGNSLSAEEDQNIEFKTVKGGNPVGSITNQSEKYAVGFLNGNGGRILWGIEDTDQKIVGVSISPKQKDEIRRVVIEKLRGIQPQLDPSRFELIFHQTGENSEIFVVELQIPNANTIDIYYTSSSHCFLRLNGATQKLTGPQLTDFISRRKQTIKTGEVHEPLLKLATRIRRIFTEHGLEPAHLTRFFKIREAPFSIALSDLKSDSDLFNWLDETKIEWIARTFLIRREWIDGEDKSIHNQFYFDRDPRQFLSTISKHADQLCFEKTNDSPYAYFLRWGIGKNWERKGGGRIFVIIAIPIACISSNRTIFKYISDLEPYPWTNHARGNIQLRAWARLLFKTKNIACFGSEVDYKIGEQIGNNSTFLREVIMNHRKHTRDDWHPEDYALSPKESVVSKDHDTLPLVLEYLKQHNLPC